MRLLGAALWLLALAAAYWLGAQGPASLASGSASIASFEAALGQSNRLRRSIEVSRFLRTFDVQRIDEVVEIVEAQGSWFDQPDHQLLMAAWVPIDSLAAVDWAFSRPGVLKRRASVALVEALGFHDPISARSVVTSLDSPKLLDILHFHMVRGWARSDRQAELTRYLENLPRSAARKRAIGALATEILKRGPDLMIAWADAISDDANEGFKQAVFQRSVNALAQIDPPRAAHWIDGHFDRGVAKRILRAVANSWVRRDPAAAMEWLLTLPEENNRRELVVSTFSDWLTTDPRSAENWARSAAPAPAVDPAVRALVRHYLAEQPGDAMDWAHRIHDSTVRARVLTSAGRAWFRKDPDAFMAWLPASGLESQVRDLILNAPGRRARAGPKAKSGAAGRDRAASGLDE